MRFNVHKKASRILGISESFTQNRLQTSVLAGVVMRADGLIDGFTFSNATIKGMDSTEKIIGMVRSLEREDVNLLLLNGCIISRYNVIDLYRLFQEINLPLISVTYKESPGLEKNFRKVFPHDWLRRVKIYRHNGPRIPLILKTGFTVFTRFIGINETDTHILLNKLVLHGAIPETLRVARILARSLARTLVSSEFL